MGEDVYWGGSLWLRVRRRNGMGQECAGASVGVRGWDWGAESGNLTDEATGGGEGQKTTSRTRKGSRAVVDGRGGSRQRGVEKGDFQPWIRSPNVRQTLDFTG